MKLINDLIIIDLKSGAGEYLLVHGLLGYLDLLTLAELQIIQNWQAHGIDVQSKAEHELYTCLCARKYIVSAEEEMALEQRITQAVSNKRKEIISQPRSASFILSYDCNFACPYCFERELSPSKAVLSLAQVDAVLALYSEAPRHVCLYGGEPLLPPHRPVISHIMDCLPQAKYSVITNGYYLLDYVDLFKTVDVTHIQVTLDGFAARHNQTRCLKGNKAGGTFTQIMQGITTCLQEGIAIKIRMNLTLENVAECLKLKEHLSAQFENSSLLSFDLQELFQYDDAQRKQVLIALLEDKDSAKRNLIMEAMHPLARYFYNGSPLTPQISTCVSTLVNRFYDPLGDIYSCFLAVGQAHKRIGRYYPQLELASVCMLQRCTATIEQCSNCPYRYLCGGGCANALPDEGDCHRANCSNMRFIVDTLVPEVFNRVYKKRAP